MHFLHENHAIWRRTKSSERRWTNWLVPTSIISGRDQGTHADHPQWLDPDPVQYGPDPWLTTQNLTRMVAHRPNTVQQLHVNRFFEFSPSRLMNRRGPRYIPVTKCFNSRTEASEILRDSHQESRLLYWHGPIEQDHERRHRWLKIFSKAIMILH
jgi:hypothetical protein